MTHLDVTRGRIRSAIVRACLDEGMTKREIAERWGVSAQLVSELHYRWTGEGAPHERRRSARLSSGSGPDSADRCGAANRRRQQTSARGCSAGIGATTSWGMVNASAISAIDRPSSRAALVMATRTRFLPA